LNSSEAKKILLAWRPGHGDLRDPQVAEALEQSRHDPELHAWLEKHTTFQRTVEKSFRAAPVPDDLRQRILTGAKVTKLPSWSRTPAWLAVAAALVLLLGLSAHWFKPPAANSFEKFRDRTVRGVQRTYPAMELVTDDMNQIRQFLANRKAPADYVLPPGLSRLPVIGAGILTWQGKEVSMICLDSTNRGTLFLFVLDRSTVKEPPSKEPEFAQIFQMMTASWTQDGKVYLLAGHGGMEELHRHW
jgi:hypothetical protein